MNVVKEKTTIKEQAQAELSEELVKELRDKLKKKLKESYLAKQVVSNLDREIQDLELEISHKLEGI